MHILLLILAVLTGPYIVYISQPVVAQMIDLQMKHSDKVGTFAYNFVSFEYGVIAVLPILGMVAALLNMLADLRMKGFR